MISSAAIYKVAELLNNDNNIIYRVPRYQREYRWSKRQWEALFDDISENDPGYYLGSIICVNNSKDALQGAQLELIDGQQRMATISVLMLCLYTILKKKAESASEDEKSEVINLKNRLIIKKTQIPRLVLQQQNYNNADYIFLLGEEGLISKHPKPKNHGYRLLAKAYKYFMEKINSLGDDKIWDFAAKLYDACTVKIEVDSHADAYILFESLNNRGVPLSAVDIIKNKLLATLEYKKIGNIDDNYIQWQQIMDNLGNDYVVQDRYFRQYLNAFKSAFNDKLKFSIATRSNLIQLYESLIDLDPEWLLDDTLLTSESYAVFTAPGNLPEDNVLKKPLLNLARIRGAATYILLLYLFKNKSSLKLDDNQLKKIIELLISFFVRRNITDLPPTRDLSRIFMDIISAISSQTGDAVYTTIKAKLVGLSASDAEFRTKLEGNIYTENADSTRFLLAMLAEEGMTKETWIDLWSYRSNGKDFMWTIEHVLPQGENLPDCWIDMIAAGDKEKARKIQEEYAHKIGNLTLSGYNANLSNKCFKEKRDKQEDGKYIGYKNGLKLNEDLAIVDEWKVEQIDSRTAHLVARILQLFPLD